MLYIYIYIYIHTYYIYINKQWFSYFLIIFWNYTMVLEFYYMVTLIYTSITWCIYIWSPLTQNVISSPENYPGSHHESYYQQQVYIKNEALWWIEVMKLTSYILCSLSYLIRIHNTKFINSKGSKWNKSDLSSIIKFIKSSYNRLI